MQAEKIENTELTKKLTEYNHSLQEIKTTMDIKVKCNLCDFISSRTKQNLLKSKITCPNCVIIKNTQFIKDNNFTIVNIIIPTKYNICCNTCNSIRSIEISKNTKCIPCATCTTRTTCAKTKKITNIKTNIKTNIMSEEKHKLHEFFKSLELIEGTDYIMNYSSENISELDFYFPNFNFAIEINGLALHTVPGLKMKNENGELTGKSDIFKTKHRDKYLYCKTNNIFLLQITDVDIRTRLDVLKSMIINKLGKTIGKIHARKCQIREIPASGAAEAMSFLDNNHLQGAVGSRQKIGLYYEDELVSLMTFAKSKEDWDLNRFCNKALHTIPGAFSKLLSYAVKTLGYEVITSFSDNMYSDGALYKNNGFILDYEIGIDYKYTDTQFNKLIYKSQFMKSKIKSNPDMIYIEGMTEKELMEMNNYSRYYDAGKIKWKYIGNIQRIKGD